MSAPTPAADPASTARPGATPRAVAFSNDGQFMVTGNEAGVVRVYDRNGALKATLEAGDGLRSVGFGPTGTDKPAVVAGSARRVSVWSSLAATESTNIDSSSDVYTVALSPDGQRVAFGTEDGSVVLSNAVTGDQLARMRRPKAPDTASAVDTVPVVDAAPVVDVGWTPDGTRVAAIDTDGHVVLWDSTTATPVWDIAAHTRGKALDVSNDGLTIATAGDDRAKIWDLASGKEQTTYFRTSGPAWDVDLSRDGKRLLVVDYNGYLFSYDTADPYDFTYPEPGTRRVAAALDPTNNDRALVASVDSSAAVMDVSRDHSRNVIALDVTPDGTVVTAAGDNGTLRHWSEDGLLEGKQDTGDTAGITDMALSTDGRTVAILYESEVNSQDGSDQTTVRVLRVGEDPDPDPYLVHGDRITAIAITGDGRFVATAEDGTHAIMVSDKTGQVAPRRLDTRRARITGLAFGGSPDKLAAVYADDTAQWWISGSESKPVHLNGSQQFGPAYTVEWSPNGELIATAGGGNVPEVWDARTGDRKFTLESHTQPVYDVAFAGDGRIATVGADREVVIWDVTSDQPKPQSRRTFSSWGIEVVFSPDGSRVYIAGARGAPYVVYLNDDELRKVAQSRVARHVSPEECRRYVAPAGPCPGG